MSTPWLVLDSHYLCHRAFHSQSELSWKGRPTGVVFQFLKSITFLKDEFQTDRVVFCFEHPHLFRRDIYPAYKIRRRSKDRTDAEKEAYSNLCIQISELHKRYLPAIGFKNVFSFNGMESDDIMASIAGSTREEVILVTSDKDLYQCLAGHVSIFSPSTSRLITANGFRKIYQIKPSQWAVVKAIAGCPSDEVEGIRGVGELTALRYVRGELKPTSKAYQSITSPQGRQIVRANRRLVQLPYEGCPVPQLREDQITRRAWLDVCSTLGMKSIAGRPPVLSWRSIK